MKTLALLISDYLVAAEQQKKLSLHTIKAYRIDLHQFAEFTQGNLVDTDMLREYVIHLNKNFSPRSPKRKLASIRAFYNDIWTSGIIDLNPFEKLRLCIHSPQQLPRIIPQETIETLLQCAYDKYKGDRTTLRDIVVLELLFSTGLRVSELCSLSNDNFDLKENSARLLINGKGRKERIIQLTTPELITRLLRCIQKGNTKRKFHIVQSRWPPVIYTVSPSNHHQIFTSRAHFSTYNSSYVPPYVRHITFGSWG